MHKKLPIIIVSLAIVCVAVIVVMSTFGEKYLPSDNVIDYASAYDLADNEYTIVLNNEMIDERAVEEDGNVYLNVDFAGSTINSRIYWDENENRMIYTTPDAMQIYEPDQTEVTVQYWDSSETQTTDYPVIRQIGDAYYVDMRFVTDNTKMDYTVNQDPNRIRIRTNWDEEQTVTADSETAIRYQGGIKADIFRKTEKGETMVYLQSAGKWYNVVTSDGYFGWVKASACSEPESMTPQEPSFEEPVYSNIQKDYKIDMAWHQITTADANEEIDSILTTTPGVNTMSPTWFSFSDTDGNVASLASADYVTSCHDNGREVWALFSNEFASDDGSSRNFDSDKTAQVISDTAKRQTAIRQVMDYIAQNGIDGLNVDFEVIPEANADDYIEFIRELSIACRASGIVLSVDNYVPQYTYYYNRTEQGKVCDYVVIMGYDETPAGSETPGPVASSSFVEQGISDTLEMVDASKVINGIPFYSRVWCTAADGTVTSFACGMTEALGYLTDHGVTPQMQESTGLNYGSYVSDIDGGTYEIWLQDADSVTTEMQMVKDNNLAGAAAWKIGFESGTDIWDIISAGLQ
jgi:spore germination protein YaaH